MAANLLARAARRLTPCAARGLGDALTEGQPAAAAASRLQAAPQQPWALTSLRAHSGGSGADDSLEQPGGAGPSTALGLGQAAAASSSAAAAAEQAVAAATRARPPPGHTDFEQRQLMMLYTCGKCGTRAAKAFSKQSYERGVVIVECPGCQARHLIADHLGWFGQKGTVEEFAAERGQMVVRKLADGTVELTPEDLMGASLLREAEQAAAAAAAAEAGGGGGRGGGGSVSSAAS